MGNDMEKRPQLNQDNQEKVVDMESLEVANRKLELLQQEDFENFVVRFINIGEYREMIKNGIYKDGVEAMPAGYDYGKEPFRKWVKSRAWVWRATQGTNWDHAVEDMKRDIPAKLRHAWETSRVNNPEPSREAFLREAREYLLKMTELKEIQEDIKTIRRFTEEDENKLSAITDTTLAKKIIGLVRSELNTRGERRRYHLHAGESILETQIKEILTHQNYPGDVQNNVLDIAMDLWLSLDQYWAPFGVDRLENISRFIERPESFTDPEELRELAHDLQYWPNNKSKMVKQWHVAMVIHKDTVGSTVANWYYLKNVNANGTPAKDKVLGCVVLMPDRPMMSEIIQASSQAKELAHPVFDRTGEVRWPRL